MTTPTPAPERTYYVLTLGAAVCGANLTPDQADARRADGYTLTRPGQEAHRG